MARSKRNKNSFRIIVFIFILILAVIISLFAYFLWLLVKDNNTPRVPEGIYPEQIKDSYTDNGINYAIYQRTSFNIPIEPSFESAGILYATEKDEYWNHFAKIEELADSKNNPYFLDFDSENIYLLIVDTSGAGSGEGIAKLLQRDQKNKAWSKTLCFYYSPDHFKWEKEQGTLEETSNAYIANFPEYHYKLNPETGNYESYYFNSKTQTTGVATTEHCSDFRVIDLATD